MSILAGENRTFSLNPCRVTITAPEDCECERLDESNIKITLASLPGCIIHLDIVPYDQSLDPNPNVPLDYNRFAYDSLCDEIYGRFNFDPRIERMESRGNLEFDGWFRVWCLHNQNNIEMEIWMHRYDSWMFRVMAAKLKKEESSHISSHIRCLVENIVVEIESLGNS